MKTERRDFQGLPLIGSLFDRWNQSLMAGDAQQVVANYPEHSILLPPVSNKLRLTPADKQDCFQHCLENGPSGRIDMRYIDIGCNAAFDGTLYTLTFVKTRKRSAGITSLPIAGEVQHGSLQAIIPHTCQKSMKFRFIEPRHSL